MWNEFSSRINLCCPKYSNIPTNRIMIHEKTRRIIHSNTSDFGIIPSKCVARKFEDHSPVFPIYRANAPAINRIMSEQNNFPCLKNKNQNVLLPSRYFLLSSRVIVVIISLNLLTAVFPILDIYSFTDFCSQLS